MDSEQAQKLIDEVFDFCCDAADTKNPQEIYNENKDFLLEKIDTAINLNPENADAYTTKGFLFDCLNDENAAYECYKKALSIDPNNTEAKESIALYEKFNTNKRSPLDMNLDEEFEVETFSEKLTIWHILIFKIIILAGAIWFLMHFIFST